MNPGFRTVVRPFACLALVLGSLLASSSLVRGAEMGDLLRSHGLQPVDPPRPAADFSLPRLGGGELALSDLSGRWVVLTFWASWCGPCRAEMPSLEALHQSHSARGLAVFGVALDREIAAAHAFVEEHRLTFPQVWDQQSRVGATYQATAIPVSFLVDPAGRVVALSRGARDWTQLAGLMDRLIESMPPDSAAEPVYATAMELPGVSAPPTADLYLSEATLHPGDEFVLEIHLRWAGHMDEYLPQPPRVSLPAGVTQNGVTASTSSRDGGQVVVYQVTLQAAAEGSFALDPVELRYQPRFATDVATARIEGPTIQVVPRTLAGLRPRTFALISGGVAVTALAGLAVGWRWTLRRNQGTDDGGSSFDSLQARYQEARNLRLQGDGPAAALLLMDLLAEVREPSESEAAEHASLAEDLRFGGRVPAAGELDRLQREVGRRLEAQRHDPDETARKALRLQDDEERS